MLGMIAAVITVLTFGVFIAIAWWAYSPRFRKTHEQDGMIPFLDESAPGKGGDDTSRKQP